MHRITTKQRRLALGERRLCGEGGERPRPPHAKRAGGIKGGGKKKFPLKLLKGKKENKRRKAGGRAGRRLQPAACRGQALTFRGARRGRPRARSRAGRRERGASATEARREGGRERERQAGGRRREGRRSARFANYTASWRVSCSDFTAMEMLPPAVRLLMPYVTPNLATSQPQLAAF